MLESVSSVNDVRMSYVISRSIDGLCPNIAALPNTNARGKGANVKGGDMLTISAGLQIHDDSSCHLSNSAAILSSCSVDGRALALTWGVRGLDWKSEPQPKEPRRRHSTSHAERSNAVIDSAGRVALGSHGPIHRLGKPA